MTGPLSGLFGALLDKMSGRNEFSVFIDDTKRERILRGLFDNFYADCTAEVIFDTSRGWCGWMPAIERLFPDAKVIACVRELPWVVDSIERLIQRNVFSPSSIFNYSAGGTVYTRAKQVVAADGMVGGPYDALKQASYGTQRDRLLLLQYETLTTDPAKAMQSLYTFIGEPVFDHDFGHVDYDVTEFDERAGTPGLHTVRPRSRPNRATRCCRRICSTVLSTTPSGATRKGSPRATGRVRSRRPRARRGVALGLPVP